MKLEFLLSENQKNEFKAFLANSIKEVLESINPKTPVETGLKELLSRKEACQFLGCSLTSLYHYQRNGQIPFLQVGRRILFDKIELVNHLKLNASK